MQAEVKSSNYRYVKLRLLLPLLGLAIPWKFRVKNSDPIQKSPGRSNMVIPGSRNIIPPGLLGLVLPRGTRTTPPTATYNLSTEPVCQEWVIDMPDMPRLLFPLALGASHEGQSKQPTFNSICCINIMIFCMDYDCIIPCLPFPRALGCGSYSLTQQILIQM